LKRQLSFSGLDDIAVMGEPVEQCGGHFGVAEARTTRTSCATKTPICRTSPARPLSATATQTVALCDRRPFGEREIGGDNDRGLLVEPVDQVEQPF
jgi:hypothetical protein